MNHRSAGGWQSLRVQEILTSCRAKMNEMLLTLMTTSLRHAFKRNRCLDVAAEPKGDTMIVPASMIFKLAGFTRGLVAHIL